MAGIEGYPSRGPSMGRAMTEAQMRQANAPKLRARYDATAQEWTIAGVTTETFMGPLQPIVPTAQDSYLGAVGRQFDYNVGYNLNYTPRSNLGVSFAELYGLAYGYDLLSTVISTRQDQLVNLEWSIQPKDKSKKPDATCAKIQDFLEYPDRFHNYADWARPILYDMFVGDCATLYPRKTNGGELYALEVMDGTRIFPLIDAGGRTPLPPSPAYQQILKGIPSVDYTCEELIYRPRNLLAQRVYGMSPVEQIIVSVNIALRRQLFQLNYYQEGSIPDAFATVPANWTTENIRELQAYWDSKFENQSAQNMAQRRKMKWIPDSKITFAKDAVLKDAFDEWLARIVCYAFSVEPTPFVSQTNRATAETVREQSLSEGLGPMKRWWTGVMNYVIASQFGRRDIVFEFKEEEATSPLEAAQIAQIYVSAGVLTIDEAREDLGRDPLTKEQMQAHADLMAIKNPVKPEPGDDKPDAKDTKKPPAADQAEKLAKLIGERRNVMIQRQRMTRSVKRAFRDQAAMIAKQATSALGKSADTALAKDDRQQPEIGSDAWLDIVFDWDAIFGVIPPAVMDPLTRTSVDGVQEAVQRLPVNARVGVTLSDGFVNDYARDYARDRAAEMIGKKWIDGVLVDNPDAKWVITAETREAVRLMIERGIAEGWTPDEFAANLQAQYAFSAARAEVIARTETRLADTRGNVAGWRETGVVQKKVWLLSEDEPCDKCVANADQGAIDLDDLFVSGDDAPPLHPACRCVLSPVVDLDSL